MSGTLSTKTDFHGVWRQYITTGETENIPDMLKCSWDRCREMGFDPRGYINPFNLDQTSVQKRVEENKDLHSLLESHSRRIEEQFDFVPFAIFFADADEYILSVKGNDKIIRILESATISAGSSISESRLGSTAPGIGLIEGKPISVVGEEHYSQQLHWASCFSVPVLDQDRTIMGCLDFTSTHDFGEKLKHLIPYFLSIANSLQFELFLRKKLALFELHDSYFRSTFDYADKMLILVNREGNIVNLNAAARNALKLPPNKIVRNRNVQELLDLGLPWGSSSQKALARFVTIRPPYGVNSSPFAMETIPIFNQAGNEIASLLKLEKVKVKVPLPAKPCNTARFRFENIIGRSRQTRTVIARAKKVAGTLSSVLIEGETGTGKELFAHAIHNASPCCNGPFVALNCCAIPQELIESELFGYDKGAYTGARREGNMGKFEMANGGTIFLDEIHTMNVSAQMKLLRVLEDRQITRIGGRHAIPLNLRIISASSRSLELEMEKNHFIGPLFFRLNVVRLRIPSLQERKEDIPDLTRYFIEEMKSRFQSPIREASSEVLAAFARYSWPGNVRELRNLIECVFNFAEGEVITLDDLEGNLSTPLHQERTEACSIKGITKKLMVESLSRYGGVKEAADFLGISVSTFYRWMKKFDLSK
jgi:transcriptional regulator of acetoin/glycerol metabolism